MAKIQWMITFGGVITLQLKQDFPASTVELSFSSLMITDTRLNYDAPYLPGSPSMSWAFLR